MKKTRVAAVQMNSLLGKTRENLAAIERFTTRAARRKAHLVLFPETCLQGHWVSTEVYAHAEALPDGKSVRKVEWLCKKLKIHVSFGMAALCDGIVYNAQVLVGPKGYMGCSCKLHMSGDEYLTYRGGTDSPVFDIGVCKVGQVVCYDNQFPETHRILALKGAEVILMPHAGRSGQWKTVKEEKERVAAVKASFKLDGAVRAKENATFCISSNQAGRGGTTKLYPKDHDWQPHHAGGIVFFAPDGEVIAESKTDRVKEEMVVKDLDPARLDSARGFPNFQLRNRRPELYGELTRPVSAPT